jgi:hypothetical protein
MKTILLISFILPLLVFGQPIDYNNFDSKTAEKVLFEKLLYYRDTVKTFASGIKIAEYSKNIKNYKENSKWNWSEDAYKFFSRPNCNKICSDNRVYHVDVENLVFSQKVCGIFSPLIYKDFPKEFYTKNGFNQFEYRSVSYSENALMTTRKFKTYQEMADGMIKIWDNSPPHQATLRWGFFSVSYTSEYNKIAHTQVACAVSYKNGTFWSTLNIVY